MKLAELPKMIQEYYAQLNLTNVARDIRGGVSSKTEWYSIRVRDIRHVWRYTDHGWRLEDTKWVRGRG